MGRSRWLGLGYALLVGLSSALETAVAQQQQQQQQQEDDEVPVCEGHVLLSKEYSDAWGPLDVTAASVRLIVAGGIAKEVHVSKERQTETERDIDRETGRDSERETLGRFPSPWCLSLCGVCLFLSSRLRSL